MQIELLNNEDLMIKVVNKDMNKNIWLSINVYDGKIAIDSYDDDNNSSTQHTINFNIKD